jgi:rSAM/selenodomain-associated transferase 1
MPVYLAYAGETMRSALIVVGKAPEAGLTKTRLVPPLTPLEAAELYRAFLLDAVDLGLKVDCERLSVVHPRGAAPALKKLLPPPVHLVEQPTSGLGDALAFAFERHFESGFERVVLIGSDNPSLPAEPVEQAFAALDSHDLSIGPSADGGYYLIGLRQAHLDVFQGIAWSTPQVYAQTLSRARRLNLRVHAGREWYDVDTPADLERLRLDLRSASEAVARHTRAAMRRLAEATPAAEPAASAFDPTAGRTRERSARRPRGPVHAGRG